MKAKMTGDGKFLSLTGDVFGDLKLELFQAFIWKELSGLITDFWQETVKQER